MDSFHELWGSMSVPAFDTRSLSARGQRNGTRLWAHSVIIHHHLRLI